MGFKIWGQKGEFLALSIQKRLTNVSLFFSPIITSNFGLSQYIK